MPPTTAGAVPLTVIIPSLNKARYLDETLRSVFDQDYPNLECIVVDGGSTDGSVEILEKYDSRLAHWTSEPDGGQAAAINKGLRRATGTLVAFQNADDPLCPGSLAAIARAHRMHEADVYYGNGQVIDAGGAVLRPFYAAPHSYAMHLYAWAPICWGASFWRRTLCDRFGLFDESYHYCFDREFFLRLGWSGCRFHQIDACLSTYRSHEDTKSAMYPHRFREERSRIEGALCRGEPARTVARVACVSWLAIHHVLRGRIGYVAAAGLRRLATW